MKHEKALYTCDRCGKEINAVPSEKKYILPIRRYLNVPMELYAETVDREGLVCDDKLVIDKVPSMEIVEQYKYESRHYHLCGECRESFERFMKNGC